LRLVDKKALLFDALKKAGGKRAGRSGRESFGIS